MVRRSHRVIEVMVLGHRYPIRVPDSEVAEQRARESARLLNERMDAIARATGEAAGLHLAVMAALSLADEAIDARDALGRQATAEASRRHELRSRSERILSLVDAEIADRGGRS